MLAAREFCKYHALGNDYLVIDGATWGRPSPEDVVALCDRHRGVGADGVLCKLPSAAATVGLRIVNPDGSDAEKSGNGLRIFARCMYEQGYVTELRFSVETPGGVVRVALAHEAGTVGDITVDMGQAQFTSAAVAMTGPARDTSREVLTVGDESVTVTAVSMGNPHCVVFVNSLDVARLRVLGPRLERHPAFTNRTNVQLVRVRSRAALDMLVWERGAGETAASGSSSCAAAAAARLLGHVDPEVSVHMPGGTLRLHVADDFAVRMTGPASPICKGQLIL